MLIEQVIEFELGGLGVAWRSGNPARIEMLSMTKMWQKTYCFFSFSFF